MQNIIRIDQTKSCVVTPVVCIDHAFRYAFDRSADSQQSDSKGQDYLTISQNKNYLAFVQADGVSQSFFGEIASSFLGDTLLRFLVDHGEGILNGTLPFHETIENELQEMAFIAASHVENYKLSHELPGMLLNVLEHKRKMGSQTTFTAGFIDLKNHRMALAWMGDQRLRLWKGLQEVTLELLGEDTFQTSERWSTSSGLIGQLHSKIIHDPGITRLISYTDGLAILDPAIQLNPVTNENLQTLIQSTSKMPQSDDVCYFELNWGSFTNSEKPNIVNLSNLQISQDNTNKIVNLRWDPIKNADTYQIAIISSEGQLLKNTSNPFYHFKFSDLPKQNLRFAVRANVNGRETTKWGDPLLLGNFMDRVGWIIPKKNNRMTIPQAVLKPLPVFTSNLLNANSTPEQSPIMQTYHFQSDSAHSADQFASGPPITEAPNIPKIILPRTSTTHQRPFIGLGRSKSTSMSARRRKRKTIILIYLVILLSYLLFAGIYLGKRQRDDRAIANATLTETYKPTSTYTPTSSATTTQTPTPTFTITPTNTTEPTFTSTPRPLETKIPLPLITLTKATKQIYHPTMVNHSYKNPNHHQVLP